MPSTVAPAPKAPAYRREPKQKQELLVAAARELFAEQGYDGTSTVQIAERAGVSEGILFHHFGSKKKLFAQVAEDYAREQAAAIFPPGKEEQTTMAAVVTNAFAFAREHETMDRVFQQRGPELAEMVLMRQREIMVSTIENNLRYNLARKRIRECDPRLTAEFMFALVNGAINSWRLSGDPARENEYVAETIRHMEAVLAPTNPAYVGDL